MSLYLLPNIRKVFKNTLTKVWFVDTDYSIEEEQVIMKYMDVPGPVSISSGTIFCELILFVTVDTADEASSSSLPYEEVFSTLHHILGPVANFTATTPVSKYPTGPQTLKIMYGPDLLRIPTTLSQELVALFRELNLGQVLRVDLGRCFTCTSHHALSELTTDLIIEAIKAPRHEITYPEDLSSVSINSDVIHYASDIIHQSGTQDLVCSYIMKKSGALAPVAQHVAHLPNISIPSTSVATALSFKIRAALNLTKEMSSFHYAILQSSSSLGFVSQQLDTLRMQRSIFVENSALSGFLGAYVASDGFNNKLPLAELKDLYSTVMVQSSTAARAGIPLVGGFCRFLSSRNQNQGRLLKPMIYESYLASAIGTNLTSAAYGPGNLLVALGTFSPAVVDDGAPFYYRDSALDYNKVAQTLNAFYSSAASPCVTSSLRDLGKRTVKEHIFALLKSGGVNLYISGLPEALVFQLKNIPESEWHYSLEQLLDVYFFNTYSNLLFLTLDTNKIYTTLGQQFRPVEILQRAARLYRCTVQILGQTVVENGIHILNDLLTPFDYTAKKNSAKIMYSMFKPPEEPGFCAGRGGDEPDLECVVLAPSYTWAEGFVLLECVRNILLNPTVGSKSYIVHHIDRCGNGLVVQQPGVGPLDLPLSDYGLVLHSLVKPAPPSNDGGNEAAQWSTMTLADLLRIDNPTVHENMPATCQAVGEQALRMALSPADGAIWAMTELLTNMMLGPRMELANLIITTSVAWDPADDPEQLKQTLLACKAFAQELNVNFVVSSASSSVPQDSRYLDAFQQGEALKVFKNIVFSGACKVTSLRGTVPVLRTPGNVLLHLSIDPTWGIAGSVFESIYSLNLGIVERISATKVAALFSIVQDNIESGIIVSGHDVSDGGVVVSLIEICLSTDYTVRVTVPTEYQPLAYLFSESPGAVLEMEIKNVPAFLSRCQEAGLYCRDIGQISPSEEGTFSVVHKGKVLLEQRIASLRSTWFHHSDSTISKFSNDLAEDSPFRHDYGSNEVDFRELQQQLLDNAVAFYYSPDIRSKVAVLTWPGMVKEEALAWAFTNAQFDVYTVCVTEINSQHFFDEYKGVAIGCSSGCIDVQIAAAAAMTTLVKSHGDSAALAALLRFYRRQDTFSVGCGEFGFTIASHFIHNLDVAASSTPASYPEFQYSPITLEKTKSGVYESRWLTVRILDDCPSVMLAPCKGMVLPCWVQGTYLGLSYSSDGMEHRLFQTNKVACTFHGQSSAPEAFARHYPRNPSGNSGVAGLCSINGRHLALLFDPSLTFFPFQWQHLPPGYEQLKTSPWSLPFYHMHTWCLS